MLWDRAQNRHGDAGADGLATRRRRLQGAVHQRVHTLQGWGCLPGLFTMLIFPRGHQRRATLEGWIQEQSHRNTGLNTKQQRFASSSFSGHPEA